MASAPMVGCEGSGQRNRWDVSKVYMRKSFKGSKAKQASNASQSVAEESRDNNEERRDNNENPMKEADNNNGNIDAPASDGSTSLNGNQISLNPPVNLEHAPNNETTSSLPVITDIYSKGFNNLDGRILIKLEGCSKQQIRELREKLSNELEQVRGAFKKFEARELELKANGIPFGVNTSYSASQFSGNDIRTNGGKEATSEVASGGLVTPKQAHRDCSIVRQHSISMVTGDFVEKEKRTPKANSYYRNSEFVLGKEKFPPPESRKSKGSKKSALSKSNAREMLLPPSFPTDVYKQCIALLTRLMKHKHGWIFNAPVDPKALGIEDYFSVIKKPMDLGTVKSNVEKYFYNSPEEFAEDVRLTFFNAMTYNPKGHEVYVMAEQLLQMFEDRWKIIIEDHLEKKMSMRIENIRTLGTIPNIKKVPVHDLKKNLKPMEHHPGTYVKPKSTIQHPSRMPTLKKPKARDQHKREMTFDEKQKLSLELQKLPSDRLELIVQILKKRNPSLCQHDEEIEVDIDSFDTETLWELDRFVTNYKKSLSKIRKKALLASQMQSAAVDSVANDRFPGMTKDIVGNVNKDRQEETNVERFANAPKNIQLDRSQKEGGHVSKSSSSSSSSTDSGTSSSDSDSGSSSGSESDRCLPQSPASGFGTTPRS